MHHPTATLTLDAPWQPEPGIPHDAALAQAEVLLTWRTPVGAQLLEAAPRLQLVQIIGPGNGPARVDLPTARRLGIYVASVPDYATAFWAGKILERLRHEATELGWPQRALKKKRLGLVGLGQVGQAVAQLAGPGTRPGRPGAAGFFPHLPPGPGLGLRVWGYDPFAAEEAFTFNEVLPVPALDELFGTCEIISLHVPLQTVSRGMVSTDLLRLIPRGGLLLNFSAAKLVDTTHLVRLLEEGCLGRACFAEETGLAHPHLRDGVIANAWPEEVIAPLRRRVERLLIDFRRGQRPPHLLIDPPCPRHATQLNQAIA